MPGQFTSSTPARITVMPTHCVATSRSSSASQPSSVAIAGFTSA
jgi:hypothetical protein